jgi:hypothetical protein
MPNQKISELTTIVTVDNAVDLLPIVDTSANTTKKITPTALKSALALDNVNNTSDANKPVSTAQQDALNAKVTANSAIVAATKTKITYDAKGLVTAGDILDAADMPTGINAANIGTGVVSSTEFGYLDGVTSAIQTQLNAKQATLVSATNIKTINSTSLLGSGDIVIGATPSGVAGAIQFSNGSAFASDATNLFWDDTNNRLGVGTNAPSTPLSIISGNGSTDGMSGISLGPSPANFRLSNYFNIGIITAPSGPIYAIASNGFQVGKTYGDASGVSAGMLGVRGSGSTSATTSLLVQNSAGTTALQIRDDRSIDIVANELGNNAWGQSIKFFGSSGEVRTNFGGGVGFFGTWYNAGSEQMRFSTANNLLLGTATDIASSKFTIDSTTKGFLPPRMTTTQKNAIATPATGLVVYDSTTNKLCCYNGSTWNDLF